MDHFKAITITKISEGIIDVPSLPAKAELDQGVYIMLFGTTPIKVGCFGEGVNSNSVSRFNNYRSVGKNLNTIDYNNGSVKTNEST